MLTSKPHAANAGEAVLSPHFSVRTEVRGPGVFPQHQHDYFEVLLLLAGSRIQHIGLTDVIGDEGYLLFMPPGTPHGATIRSRNVSLFIGFSLPFLHPELSPEAARAWDHPVTLEAAPELLPFVAQPRVEFACDVRMTKRLQKMAADLMGRSGSHVLAAEAYARAQVSLFLLEVVHAFEGPLVEAAHSHRPAPSSEGIVELMAFIREHLAKQISVEDAARHLHISPSCLSARIKRATSKTFSELLSEARLLRAKEMLLYSDCRISEVAYSCGFEDHAYFSRRFRQLLGVTPGDYRKRGMPGGSSSATH
jgi:AraC-like DNA-binding protein